MTQDGAPEHQQALCPGCGIWHLTSTGFSVTHCRECWLGESEPRWRRSMRGARKYYDGIDIDVPKSARRQ